MKIPEFDLKSVIDQATREMLTKTRIQVVLSAYEQALADPKTVIPTALHAAIEGLRRV